jgi:hypothetical protein
MIDSASRFSLTLATLHAPDTNPFGAPSIVAITFAVCLIVATSKLVSIRPRAQRWLIAVSQPFFLGISAITEGSPVFYIWWHKRSFPDLDDFVAAWLYLGFGLVCAVRCLRYPEVWLRCCAAVFSFVFGSFIVAEAVMILWGFPLVSFGGWDVDWTPVLVALAVFTVIWASFVFRIRSEVRD